MYIEESFDTNFNIGYWGGGAYNVPSPWIMGWENRPWTRGLTLYEQNKFLYHLNFCLLILAASAMVSYLQHISKNKKLNMKWAQKSEILASLFTSGHYIIYILYFRIL